MNVTNYLSAEDLASGLEKSRKQGKGWQACCPAHEDHNPSLSINDGKNGIPVAFCHAGCPQDAVIDAFRSRGLWPERNENGASYTPQARKTIYKYHHANGELAFTVERTDKPDGTKEIRPRLLSGKSRWYPAPRPLYRLPELLKRNDAPVLIVEGEKTECVAASLFREYVVITTAGGSSHHHKSNYQPLQGRNIVIWPDNDKSGRDYAADVARHVTKAGAHSVRIVQLPEGKLKEGWDLADPIPQDMDVNDLLANAEQWPKPGMDANLIPADKGNELELADSLINAYTGKYAYRVGGRWYGRDGSLWTLDNENLLIRKQLRQDCRAAEFKRAGTVTSMLSVLAPDLICDKWDDNPEVCGLPGGNVIDLRTGETRQAGADEYVTRRLGSDPDFNNPPITWINTLNECLPDEPTVEYFKAYAGYCLTGYIREQNFIFAWGTGGNGKTTIFGTLSKALGEYFTGLPSSVATVRKHEGHPEAIARLDGARLAVLGDLPSGAKWNEAWLKQITGGDTITARLMNKGSFDFNPECKLITSGNQKPRLSTVDNAIRRRLVMMPFLKTFDDEENRNNKNLSENLADELPQIVAWAIEGAMDYLENGLPEIPDSIRDASDDYMEEQDTFSDWFNECIVEAKGGFLSNTQARNSYNHYNNTTVSGQFVSKINDYIKQHVQTATNGKHNGLRGLNGVGLKADSRYEDT